MAWEVRAILALSLWGWLFPGPRPPPQPRSTSQAGRPHIRSLGPGCLQCHPHPCHQQKSQNPGAPPGGADQEQVPLKQGSAEVPTAATQGESGSCGQPQSWWPPGAQLHQDSSAYSCPAQTGSETCPGSWGHPTFTKASHLAENGHATPVPSCSSRLASAVTSPGTPPACRKDPSLRLPQAPA